MKINKFFFVDCLSFSYGLEKLNLSNCPWITRNNMIMRLPTSIKELDISNCGIDQTHVMQICQRLKNLEVSIIAKQKKSLIDTCQPVTFDRSGGDTNGLYSATEHFS
jgi:hypothetical protein